MPVPASREGCRTAFMFLFVLAVVTGLTSSTASASPAPTPAAVTAAAGGEHWYGHVSSEGKGSYKLPDGGQYTGHDKYVFDAPEPIKDDKDPQPGRLNITVDTVETHPDPDPANEGCWTLRQTWTGASVIEAAISVQSNVGGQGGDNYIIDVTALQPITVYVETEYGGTIGGEPCSAGDTEGTQTLSPWLIVHSRKNAEERWRNGSNAIGLRDDLTCAVVSECTDYSSFSHLPAKIESTWSLAARECTGYSRAVRLDSRDTLFVFSPCQTKSLSSRVNFLQEISGVPKICDYAYVKRLSQACDGYKAVTRIQWSQVDWFMDSAKRNQACGVWVVDRASWRPPKIEPAEGPDSIEVVWINVGEQQVITTPHGSVKVSCP